MRYGHDLSAVCLFLAAILYGYEKPGAGYFILAAVLLAPF